MWGGGGGASASVGALAVSTWREFFLFQVTGEKKLQQQAAVLSCLSCSSCIGRGGGGGLVSADGTAS